MSAPGTLEPFGSVALEGFHVEGFHAPGHSTSLGSGGLDVRKPDAVASRLSGNLSPLYVGTAGLAALDAVVFALDSSGDHSAPVHQSVDLQVFLLGVSDGVVPSVVRCAVTPPVPPPSFPRALMSPAKEMLTEVARVFFTKERRGSEDSNGGVITR